VGKKDILRNYIAEKALKSTKQREIIADVFFNTDVHISLDELLTKVRRKSPKVGYATVYRTMKLLVECGLAAERHFGDGQSRYEPATEEGHHDHLICTECGKIIEFENQVIEDLQVEVAKSRDFVVTDHKLELYGLCEKCASKR
jgi:Fur family ferric uptake transcriptional regulator